MSSNLCIPAHHHSLFYLFCRPKSVVCPSTQRALPGGKTLGVIFICCHHSALLCPTSSFTFYLPRGVPGLKLWDWSHIYLPGNYIVSHYPPLPALLTFLRFLHITPQPILPFFLAEAINVLGIKSSCQHAALLCPIPSCIPAHSP